MTIYHIKFWNWVFLCMPPQNHKISIRVSQKQTWQSLKFSVRQDSPVGVNPVDITGYQVSNKNCKFCFSSLPIILILILINRHPSSQPPWKSLTEFALRGEPPDHSNPHFQSLVSQVQSFSHRTWWVIIEHAGSTCVCIKWIKRDSDDGAADARVRPPLWPPRPWSRPAPSPLPTSSWLATYAGTPIPVLFRRPPRRRGSPFSPWGTPSPSTWPSISRPLRWSSRRRLRRSPWVSDSPYVGKENLLGLFT